MPSSRWAASCAGEHRDVYAAVAIHPNETARAAATPAERDEVLAQIASLAELDQVRAVGETGLDYYRDDARAAAPAGVVPRAHPDRQAGR